MIEDVTTKVSDVWIDYFPEFKEKCIEDHENYLRAVREATPLLLSALQFMKEKPLEHIIRIELTNCEKSPIHVELYWGSEVECTIYFHDKDYGIEALESLVGLVQIDGLYTKTVRRWTVEMDHVTGAIIGSMKGAQ